jgi:hypothetical protein
LRSDKPRFQIRTTPIVLQKMSRPLRTIASVSPMPRANPSTFETCPSTLIHAARNGTNLNAHVDDPVHRLENKRLCQRRRYRTDERQRGVNLEHARQMKTKVQSRRLKESVAVSLVETVNALLPTSAPAADFAMNFGAMPRRRESK